MLILSLLSPIFAVAQEGHSVGVDIEGGFSSLIYNSSSFDYKVGGGGGLTVSYRYFFNKSWGVGAGVHASILTSGADFSGKRFSYDFYDAYNQQNFVYQVVVHSLCERQQAAMLSIPVMAYYQYGLTDMIKLQAGLGLMFQVPLYDRYEVKDGLISTSGLYPEIGQNFSDLPHHYFGSYSINLSDSYGLTPFNLAPLVDLGAVVSINSLISLYAGLTASYSLLSDYNNFIKTPAYFRPEHAVYTNCLSNTAMPIHHFTAGVKFGVTFGFGKAQGRDKTKK